MLTICLRHAYRESDLADGDDKLTLGVQSKRIGIVISQADMAELADARGSGPRSRKGVEVQVLLSAPSIHDSITARRTRIRNLD